MHKKIHISGIPEDTDKIASAIFSSRLLSAYQKFSPKTGTEPVIKIGGTPETRQNQSAGTDKMSSLSGIELPVQQPLYSFDQLIIPQEVHETLLQSIKLLEVEELVFDRWGLRKIEPHPKTALNFYGPPGTGKTLAAHAVAHKLGKGILIAGYAEIESKYHGDGPKNVKKIFTEAEEKNAVLFIDEADSLLSKRLTNVMQGSEQAINSMRSQLLICLEQFHGTVIFATNLIENYDAAFETRIRHIKFSMPDKECRKKIWEAHLPPELPLTEDVSPERLAEIDDVCGRDIRNAVIQAAVKAAAAEREVTQEDLQKALNAIKYDRVTIQKNENAPLSPEEKRIFTSKARKAIKKFKRKGKK